jgi:hypothetical protein
MGNLIWASARRLWVSVGVVINGDIKGDILLMVAELEMVG